MSRQIDWTKPVTGADREWAEQFQGAHAQLLEANDAAVKAAEAEALEGEQVGSKPNYAKMTKAELVAEIERRNAEYGPEFALSIEGKVEELRARLEEDDRADEE